MSWNCQQSVRLRFSDGTTRLAHCSAAGEEFLQLRRRTVETERRDDIDVRNVREKLDERVAQNLRDAGSGKLGVPRLVLDRKDCHGETPGGQRGGRRARGFPGAAEQKRRGHREAPPPRPKREGATARSCSSAPARTAWRRARNRSSPEFLGALPRTGARSHDAPPASSPAPCGRPRRPLPERRGPGSKEEEARLAGWR